MLDEWSRTPLRTSHRHAVELVPATSKVLLFLLAAAHGPSRPFNDPAVRSCRTTGPLFCSRQRYSGSVAALAARVVTCHGRACNNAAGLEALPWTVDWT